MKQQKRNVMLENEEEEEKKTMKCEMITRLHVGRVNIKSHFMNIKCG